MSKREVSAVFIAKDMLSPGVKSMRKSVKELATEMNAYKKAKEDALHGKAVISFDMTQAKRELKELEKAVKQEKDGAKEAFIAKQEELERLNSEYRMLGMAAKEAEKAENDLAVSMSRNSNANAGRGGGSGGSIAMMMGGLATAGIGNMLSGAVGNFLEVNMTSAFGSTVGSAISNIGGSALSGAAMGSIAGPIGAAVGAAVGGLTGAINTLAEKQQREDDAFRGEVQNLHSGAIGDMNNKLENGSAYAAEREMYKRNYSSMTDDAAGEKLYNSIMKYGDKTPYDTSVMLGKGMEMLSYGIEKEQVMKSMEMLGNIAMGSQEKFTGLSYAYAQSMNAGALNGQDRRQMVGWGFDPLEYVSKNLGVSFAEAKKMMSEGLITSEMLADALETATSEGERYHDAVNAMSDTFTGLQGQLDSAKKNIEIAMGEGYNAARKEGMEREIEAYNGEMGEKMKSSYQMIGAYEAEMENQHQQAILNALEQANADIESKGMEGLEAERRMWEAYTQAEIEYKNSEEYQMKLAAEKDLVGSIQSALVESGEYLNYGVAMANEFNKGWNATRMDIAMGETKSKGILGTISSMFSNNALKYGTPGGYPAAVGLDRVPYDNYPALLHEGERVLTRVEANRQAKGQSVQIAKLADQIVVREDADIDKIARALVSKLQIASASYGG